MDRIAFLQSLPYFHTIPTTQWPPPSSLSTATTTSCSSSHYSSSSSTTASTPVKKGEDINKKPVDVLFRNHVVSIEPIVTPEEEEEEEEEMQQHFGNANSIGPAFFPKQSNTTTNYDPALCSIEAALLPLPQQPHHTTPIVD
eukprot:12679369-Ditylum_brightwellii.AAC.1